MPHNYETEIGCLDRLVGTSASMQRLRQAVILASKYPSTVLILGESGTGKELVAQSIHALSPWRNGPFITVDCTILTDSLFESLLFGHERGSFTGASSTTCGLARAAAGGTLFFDEVGELSPASQSKLLRLLQERTILPVGATCAVRVGVRFVAATHQNLFELAERSEYRYDLLYRLNVVSLRLPPLRDRREDLPKLCDTILDRLETFLGVRRMLSSDAIAQIASYNWPGNVRELAACLERASVLTESKNIYAHDLNIPGECAGGLLQEPDLNSYERTAVSEALKRHRGNKSRAAESLGVDRKTLYRMISRLELEPDTFSPELRPRCD